MERAPEPPDNLVLVQLREMRRENDVMRGQQIRIAELLGRVTDDVVGLRSDVAGMRSEIAGMRSEIAGTRAEIAGMRSEMAGMRSEMAAMRADLGHVKSDVILLENQNMSRHGEVLSILRRLDPIERDFRARSDAVAGPPGE